MENNQIQNDKSAFKEHMKKCFNKKTLITKAVIYGVATVLLLAIAIPFFFWLIKKDIGTEIGKNGFWYICISHNFGIGFSKLEGNLPAIYAIQSLLSIVLILVFLFVTNDRITSSFIALAIVGGLFNLFQRVYSHGFVLDYFQFGFWEKFAIFNWPDMFVVIGTFGFVISLIVLSIISAVKDKDDKEDAIQTTNKVELPVNVTVSDIQTTASDIQTTVGDVQTKENQNETR